MAAGDGDFLDLATQACYLSQRDPADTSDIARAKEQVNYAIKAVCDSGEPWTFLNREYKITVDSSGDRISHSDIETAVSLSVHTIRKVLWIVNDSTGRDRLTQLSWAALEDMTQSTQETGETTGEPRYWAYISDTEFRIYPKPNESQTLGILCRLEHGNLTGDTDNTLVPVTWAYDLIAYRAAFNLLRQEGGGEAAAEADRLEARYNARFEAFKENYGSMEEEFILAEPTTWDDVDFEDFGIRA